MALIRRENVKEQLRNWIIGNRLHIEFEWKEGNSQNREGIIQDDVNVVDAKWISDTLFMSLEDDDRTKKEMNLPINGVFILFHDGELEEEFNDCIMKCEIISEED